MRKLSGMTVAVLVPFALVFGCANLQTQDARDAEIKQYCRKLSEDPRIDPIRAKVPVVIAIADPISVSMKTNDTYASFYEQPAILAWAEQREQCLERATEVLGQPPAHMVAVRSINSQNMADLYSRKITFGEFAKRLSQTNADFRQANQAIQALDARDRHSAQEAAAQEMYQRQQINLEGQRLQAEQFSTPGINCATQYVGNQAYTSCD